MNKRLSILNLMLGMLLCVAFLTACGGDDVDGSTQIVDGVNVNNGKKITNLTISQDYPEYNAKVEYLFKIEYDSKGRLSRILCTAKEYNNGNVIGNNEDNYIPMIKIDYDFRMIQVYNLSNGNATGHSFTLNDQGYIAQIANVACRYNSDGYLTNVDNVNDMWNLAYDNNDIVKSLSTLTSGKTKLYIYSYGKSNNGELIFNMTSEKKSSINSLYSNKWNQGVHSVGALIAYQAGLFGKISKHCSYLSSSSETNAIFNRNNDSSSNNLMLKCRFVCN